MTTSPRRPPLKPQLFPLLLALVLQVQLRPHTAQVISSVKREPLQGKLKLFVRRYAKLPDYNGETAKIVGITPYKRSLYVCSSVSGGRIYRVDPQRRVSLWFDVHEAMLRRTGRGVDITDKIHGGVRSIAFHPRFNLNGFFYVSLMEKRNAAPWRFRYLSRPQTLIDSDSVVYEWRVNRNNGKPLPWTQREVLRVGMPVYDHPIKQMVFFGDDLYIAHGDASVQSAVAGGGLRNDALGKILRINPLQRRGRRYTVPRSNPFVQTQKFLPETYAVGFRNPHNLCFSKRGELFVADSGRDNVEEINVVRPGGNYGWAEREGPFRHLKRGGIQTGIAGLPWDDAKNGYEYPAAMFGHYGTRGASFSGQAIAMACPIENGSPLNGVLLYANFPSDGQMYYSFLGELRRARTRGPPRQLWRATTYMPKIFFDHDNNPRTPSVWVKNLRGIVRMDQGFAFAGRVDMRFGRGSDGEIYWSSKKNGRIYEITNSVPRWKTRQRQQQQQWQR